MISWRLSNGFNTLRYIGSTFAVSMFANVSSTLFIALFYFKEILTDEELLIRMGVQTQEFRVLPLFFLLPTLMAFLYMMPFYISSSKKRLELCKRRLLNSPLMQSLIGSSGWLLALIHQHISFFFVNKFTDYIYLIKFSITMILAAVFCFMLVYYMLDFINRRWFIKELFEGAKLSSIEKVINLSIRSKFAIFYITVVIFPLILLSNYVLYYMRLTDNYSNLWHLLFIVFDCIVMMGAVTLLFMFTYRKPLLEMVAATEKIKRGKFEVHLPVVSTDELGTLSESLNETAESLNEKEFIKDTFGKMVDPHVRDYLLKGNVKLGGEAHESTILFCDIRGFTTLSEKLVPEKVVDFLNSYFERMSESIEENNGFINKFIGDAILAVFGNPVPLEHHAEAALESAIKMRENLTLLNEELSKKNLPKLSFGVGIHSGLVVAGNIGSLSRMEYTVIGDTVNLASRLEALTKSYGVSLLISEAVYTALPDKAKFLMREIDYVRVKGKLKPTRVYEVFDSDKERVKKDKRASLDLFTKAVELYRKMDFVEAHKNFEMCASECSEDSVARMYIKRCKKLIENPPSSKWDGVAVIK